MYPMAARVAPRYNNNNIGDGEEIWEDNTTAVWSKNNTAATCRNNRLEAVGRNPHPLHPRFFLQLLAPGPIFGLFDLYRLVRARETIGSLTKEIERAIGETVVIQNIVK